ncbi:hypothetical protein RLIN73S_03231 [Rhodanobacter lindaniclasticus]
MAGQLAQHLLDLRQIALAHRVEGVGIGGEQLQAVGIVTRLQRHQPGVQVFGAQIAFQTLKAAPPQITHEFDQPRLGALARRVMG